MNELFVKCECGCEGLNITLDNDTGDVFFSMWYYGRSNLTVSSKLRWIWHIIKGEPHPDEIIIGRGWVPLIIDKLRSMMVEAEYNAKETNE